MDSVTGSVKWGRGGVVALVVGAWALAGVPVVAEAGGAGPGDQGCTIRGTQQPDLLRGTSGADVICGLGGDDQLMGLGGNDLLIGDAGNDVLVGGAGNDTLRGKGGNDVEFGGDGNDRLRNWAGADQLNGGAGNDHLRGGKGADVISGGPGRDVASYAGHTAGVSASIGGGANDGRRGEGDNIGGDVEDLRGSVGNDTLVGSAGANQLFGLGGNDRITGLAGSDRLDGGGGRDVLNALDGFVDTVACGGGAGDRALADMTDQVGAGCEDVVQNDPPTNITLSPASVDENEPVGIPVGTLSATDPDPNERHTFTLVAGAGSGDNGSFIIDGTTLRAGDVFDFETKASYSVRVRVTDRDGASFAKALTVTVNDGQEPPTPEPVRATTDEDTAVTITLTARDQDGDDVTAFATSAPSHGTVGPVGAITCTGTPEVCSATVEFTPDPDYNGPAGFSFTASDATNTSTPAAVTITVDPVNDSPVAVDGTRTIHEDGALALNLDALVSDVETADPDLIYTIVTPPTNGDATTTTYTPDADFNGTDSLTFTVTDRGDPDQCGAPGADCDDAETSTTQTVTVTVDPVNDPPSAPDANLATDEDQPLTLDLAALVDDVETADGNLTYTVTQPANGTATATSYTPDPDFAGVDSFTYTVTDRGDPDNCAAAPCDGPSSATGTITVTVGAVNDAPINTLPAGPIPALAGLDEPITGVSVADVDAAADPIQVTFSVDNGTLSVATGVPAGVEAGDVAGNGTDTVTITAPLAAINTTLADPDGLVYQGEATGPDTLTMTTDDQGHNGTGGAQTDTDTVAIVVNSPPMAADQSVATDEDTARTITLSASDADGDPITFAIATGPDHGTLGAVGPVICTPPTNSCTADVEYTPDTNFNGPDSFTFTAADSFATSPPATVSITVGPVNDAPVANNDTATVTEDDPATPLDVLANDTDVEDDPITITAASDPANGTVVLAGGGTGLTYQPDPNYCNTQVGGTPDTFSYTVNGGDTATVSVTVTCVDDPPVAVNDTATVAEDAAPTAVNVLGNDVDVDGGPKAITDITQPTNGTVVTTGGATGLTYEPDPNYCNSQPGGSPDSFTYTITGGSNATVAVTVTCVDDPPVAVDDTATMLEDAAATAITVLANDTDIDAGPTTINAVTQPANGTVMITGGGTGLTYQPPANYCNDPPGTTPDTFTYTLNGGSQASVAVTVTCVNDNPIADDETFNGANSAVGNTALIVNDPTDGAPTVTGPNKTVSGDLLDGDTDVDGPLPLVIQGGTFASNDGGSVTIQADGDFVFTPAAGTSCTDTTDFFDYTLSDQNTPTAGTDTGRVTITIADCVWYVSNNAAGNAGTSTAPFDTLAQAETASAAGHTIFVFDGDNTTTGYAAGITLKANQMLTSEAVNLSVGGVLLHTGVAANRPTITDNGADVIELASGNTVTGINVDPQGAGGGIAGGTGDAGGTIADVTIVDTPTFGTQPGLELDTTTGTWNISDLTVNTNGSIGVRLNNAGTVNFASAGTNSITTAGARALDAAGATTSFGAAGVVDSITVTGSGSGAVGLTATTGTLNLGDGSGTDLALSTTSGATAALFSTHTGTLIVDAAGTDNISATGGPAINVTNAATMDFDDVDSTSSNTDGINLDSFGTGTFTALSGDITGAAAIAFDLAGGSGTVTYPGNFNNGIGATAEITGRTGGTVTLSGAISDTNDAGGGITVTGNSGGTTTFSNGSKILNTTTGTAVSFTASNGHTLNLTGGGLDIDTTSGQGINANDAGTITVTGTANSITSTTGTALNITTTDIGATGARFDTISANGAPNGIVLNTTGSVGGLTVAGRGGGTCTNADTSGCTGGTIQNTTGADNSGATPTGTGIVLNSTTAPSLTRMWIHDHSNYGIRGTAVDGFTLADSVVNGANGTSDVTGIRDSSARFVDLIGTVSVTNSDISGGYTNNFVVVNNSDTLTSTFNAIDFGPVSTAGGDDSLQVQGLGSSEVDVNVQNGTFNSARGDIFQFIGNGTGGGDLAFTGNTITNTHPAIATGGGGVTISGSAAGPVTMNFSNNSMRDALTNALTVVKSQGSGAFTGTINNNQIGDFVAPLDPNAGSLEGAGLEVTHFGGGNMTMNVTNNQIRQYNSFGMSLVAGGGVAESGQFNFNISGNTISNEGTNPNVTLFQGIGVNSGVAPGDTFQTCVNFGANSIVGAGSDTITDSDFRIRARQNTTVRLPGYAGGATDGAAVATFVEGKIGGGAQGTGAAFDNGTFIGTGTTCP